MTIHNNLMNAGDLPCITRTDQSVPGETISTVRPGVHVCLACAHLPCPQHPKQHLAPCEPAIDFIRGISGCVTPLPDSYLPQCTKNARLSLLLFCKSSIICI